MNCPWCGSPLEQGTIKSRGSNYFLPDDEDMPLFYSISSVEKRRGVLLPPSPLDSTDKLKAFICRNCKKIVIPY